MSTEDTPIPLPEPRWVWAGSGPRPYEDAYSADQMRDIREAAVAAANARWESALGAVMPADFKCWHQNAKSELPEIAAGVIENLRQRESDAWEQMAAAVAKERERFAGVKEYLTAAATGAMSRNNSEQLAAELLAQLRV